jgi:hypothetical protein
MSLPFPGQPASNLSLSLSTFHVNLSLSTCHYQPVTANLSLPLSLTYYHQPVTIIDIKHKRTRSTHIDHIPRTSLNQMLNITNTYFCQACTKITNIPSQDMCLNHVPKPVPNIIPMIQVDINGHPPIPTGSKQSSHNLLFLAVFRFLNFWGHFEGLSEGFLGFFTSMIAEVSD